MTRQRGFILAANALAVIAISLSAMLPHHPRLVYNATASVPVGFYWVDSVKVVRRGDNLLIRTPEAVRDLADRRQYLPRTVPMIKVVAALDGDVVCASGDAVWINGQKVVVRLRADSQGRPLPRWTGCHRLAGSDVFFLNAHVRDSFDGRYFGVVDRGLVLGKVRPL